MRKWKTISTQTLLTHPRVTVTEDEVELPNGHRTQYLKLDQYVDGAFVILRNAEGRILVLKEYNYPPDAWLYHFPGGGFDSSESPEAAALRELSEEVGLAAELRPIGWYYRDNRRSAEKMFYFIGERLTEKVAARDVEEEFETYWMSEAEIDALVRGGDAKNYAFLAGWALYKAHKE